jgi:mycofactocin system glycosyltransferase
VTAAATRAADLLGNGTAGAGTPLPAGFGIEMDASTRALSDGSLFGGSPARVMRLTAAGSTALAELRAGPARSAAARQLARRLTDAGLAHPIPPPRAAAPETALPEAALPEAALPEAALPEAGYATVTVVIPVRDRAAMLDRCLAAAGRQHQVLVVDDGSQDPGAVAAVAARRGATLLRRDASGGPAAARNTGLAAVSSSLIAFLDSDCVPPPGWITRLAAHFADPLVGAVAPRIVAAQSGQARSPAAAYAAACASLDLGGHPARVRPGSQVSYVPTAALLVRRSALDSVAAGHDIFDPALRYGEDVDLIWRLHDAGWRVRYEPSVRVPHDGPVCWPGLLGRRFRYGTSAAPLARRHPASLAPLVLQPWPAITVAALLGRRPAVAAAAGVAAWLDLTAAVRRAGVPADGAAGATVTAIRQTWLGLGRYATQFAAPVLLLVLARPGGRSASRRLGRRAAAASLLLGPALTAYAERTPDLDPARFTLARIADDICYGAGVWAGCLRERTVVPVRPAISQRPLRVSGPPAHGKADAR